MHFWSTCCLSVEYPSHPPAHKKVGKVIQWLEMYFKHNLFILKINILFYPPPSPALK